MPEPDPARIMAFAKNNRWAQEEMWDSGWGNEYGFVRLPRLNADELWDLLTTSKIYENQRGASEFLERSFPDQLKSKLTSLFDSVEKLDSKLSKRLSNVEVLRTGVSRNGIIGKHYSEIKKDFKEWQELKRRFEAIRIEGFWGKFF